MEPETPKGDLYRVHLNDEIPRIGSGRRWVYARVGRKWVRVVSDCGYYSAKVKISVWNRIKKERVDVQC